MASIYPRPFTKNKREKQNRLRRGSWWINYYHRGKLIQHSLHTKDRKIALHLKKKKELEIEKGRARLPVDKLISDFFAEYKKYAKTRKSKSSLDIEISRLNVFLKQTQPKKINDITTATIQNFLLGLSKEKSPATVNHYLKHIKVFLSYAVDQDYIKYNPAKKIKRLKEEKKIIRFLSKEEIKKLIRAASGSHLYPMIMTALYTGMRVGELMRLKWEDVDFEKNIIMVRKTKSKRFRVVPLNKRLRAILAKFRKKEGCIFTYKDKAYSEEPRKALYAILRKAGVKNCGWHTLRKTFASHMVSKGVSIAIVAKFLGHTDVRLTYRTYSHLAPHSYDEIDKLQF